MACLDSDGLGDLSSGNPDLGLDCGFGGPVGGFEGDFRLAMVKSLTITALQLQLMPEYR